MHTPLDPQAYDAEIKEVDQLVHQQLFEKIVQKPKVRYLKQAAYAAAAAVLLFFLLFMFKQRESNEQAISQQPTQQDIQPGQEKAILTLANGKQIELDEKQGIQTANGQISYQNGAAITQGEELQEVLLTTPLAAQYKAILPDGTAAWLNAGSSIRYPTKFTGNKRSVYITGEVYFEVAKNPSKPFFVYCDQQVLQVLGTHFNINSYGDQQAQVITTLAEGSLRVTNNSTNASRLLSPGQQASLSKNKQITLKTVNLEEVLAWKEGMFIINDQPLSHYARHIERWYDVKVDVNQVGDIRLSTIIPRNATLSQVLAAIELQTGVSFKIEGRRITARK